VYKKGKSLVGVVGFTIALVSEAKPTLIVHNWMVFTESVK